MGTSGYNSIGSGTWHAEQRCSGRVFAAAEAMNSKVAENRGLSPCGNCCGGEWPHADEVPETADRDPDEWIDKLEMGETALRFEKARWNGPEYVGVRPDGSYCRWPMGLDKVVGDTHRGQIVEDLENPQIEVEEIDWSETPLEEGTDE